jgi:hypothetical protein
MHSSRVQVLLCALPVNPEKRIRNPAISELVRIDLIVFIVLLLVTILNQNYIGFVTI